MTKKRKPLPVKFEIEDSGLHISMETKRMIIRSLRAEDEKDLIEILNDPVVMARYDTGAPPDKETLESYLQTCRDCTKKHDPFHAYALLEKNSKEFLGFIVIWHSEKPGESEVAYAICRKFQGKGYVREALDKVLHSLVPNLMLLGYKLEHKSLKKLVATVRLDNPVSKQILFDFGFQEEGTIVRYGAECDFFSLSAKSLRNEYQNFFTRRDAKLGRKIYSKMIDEDVDITAKAMAESTFGQQSWFNRSF